jgi:hypothetical protein
LSYFIFLVFEAQAVAANAIAPSTSPRHGNGLMAPRYPPAIALPLKDMP